MYFTLNVLRGCILYLHVYIIKSSKHRNNLLSFVDFVDLILDIIWYGKTMKHA